MKLAALALASFLVAAPSALGGTSLEDALLRVGLDGEAMAAAGLTTAQVDLAVEGVDDYLVANPDELSDADADYASARAEADRLRRLVRAGTASAQDVTDLATAESELATAITDRDAALDALCQAGLDELPTAEADLLETICLNRSWGLPTEFLVKDRTEAQWVALREALADERISDEYGESPASASSTLLSTERADADVAAAKTDLDTNLTSIQSAWDSAVAGE